MVALSDKLAGISVVAIPCLFDCIQASRMGERLNPGIEDRINTSGVAVHDTVLIRPNNRSKSGKHKLPLERVKGKSVGGIIPPPRVFVKQKVYFLAAHQPEILPLPRA